MSVQVITAVQIKQSSINAIDFIQQFKKKLKLSSYFWPTFTRTFSGFFLPTKTTSNKATEELTVTNKQHTCFNQFLI